MLAAQIYYEFAKEVEKMRSNMSVSTFSVSRDTQILTKQLLQMKSAIELKNKEFDHQLAELKRMIILLSQKQKF